MTRPYWKARQEAEAVAAEMARGPLTPPADELARVRALLESHAWVFAKTMADNPHWYTLRRKWEAKPGEPPNEDFVAVVRFIRKYGYVERFPDPERGWPYVMCDIGGFKYWTMGCPCEPGPYDPRKDTILINRKPLGEEARKPPAPSNVASPPAGSGREGRLPFSDPAG